MTCKADVAKKVAAVSAALPAALAAHPALALVDSRLNGEFPIAAKSAVTLEF